MAALTKNDRFVLRLARVLGCEGQLVRRSVGLGAAFGKDFKNFNVDLLALRIDPALDLTMTVGEYMTRETRSAKDSADRLLRSTGLRSLTHAHRSFVATRKPMPEETRRVAQLLATDIVDERDVVRRERALGMEQTSAWGPFDTRLWEIQEQARGVATRDENLNRIWLFVQSEFWFAGDIVGLKRALGALRLLAREHEEVSGDRRATMRWLAHQAEVCLVVALVRVARRALRTPPEIFTQELAEQLSEGLASFAALREISGHVDRYLMAVLSRAGLPPAQAAEALGVLEPQPPAYTEPLLELVERLAAEPLLAADLPRLLDWRVASVELDEQFVEPPGVPVDRRAARLLRLVAVFLRGQLAIPPTLLEPLTVDSPSTRAPAPFPRGTLLMPVGAGRASDAPRERQTSFESAPPERPASEKLTADDERTHENEQPPSSAQGSPAAPTSKRRSRTRASGSVGRGGTGGKSSENADQAKLALPTTADLVLSAGERPRISGAAEGKAGPATLTVPVHNAGVVACRVIAAVAYSDRLGEITGEVPALVHAGAETQMQFPLPPEVQQVADGERITVELTDDDGRAHRLVLRHISEGTLVAASPASL
jgi:hypothetical protein